MKNSEVGWNLFRPKMLWMHNRGAGYFSWRIFSNRVWRQGITETDSLRSQVTSMKVNMIPKYWIDFLDESGLRGLECEIPENDDLSNIGGFCLEVFSEKNIFDETENYYPGLVVKKDGYIAVAGCSHGSGDPYFINLQDGRAGPLYRIYHDEVCDESYNQQFSLYDLVLVSETSLSGSIQLTSVNAEFRPSLKEVAQQSFPVRPDHHSDRPSNIIDEFSNSSFPC